MNSWDPHAGGKYSILELRFVMIIPDYKLTAAFYYSICDSQTPCMEYWGILITKVVQIFKEEPNNM
jgi:hypothetical protein